MKVAGSSVEVALSSHCGDDDILTGTNHIDEIQSDRYEYPVRNNILKHTLKNKAAIEVLSRTGNLHKVTPEMMNSGIFVEFIEPRFHTHVSPDNVLNCEDIDVSDYKKITIARNPWDMIVSFFWWSFYKTSSGYVDTRGNVHTANGAIGFTQSSHPEVAPIQSDDRDSLSRKLEIFCQLYGDFNGPIGMEKNKNVLDWFIDSNKKYYQIDYDHILRHECLQDDYDAMCDDIGIKKSTLPRLKSSQRKVRLPYSDYFNEWTRDLVDPKLEMWVEKFGYSF
jgi:hypothetical protein